MRLRSDFWVKAYLRQAAVGGCPGAVVRHGDDTAGAIFIKVNRLDGTVALFGPAPAGLDDADNDRRFMAIHGDRPVPESEADALLAREARFDSDLWVIEIESSGDAHFFDGWLLATPT